MKQVDITICMASDGTYSAYCNDHPALFGMGNSAASAKQSLEETLRLVKEDGPEVAAIYPSWLKEQYSFMVHWDVKTMLEYYSGIITPTAIGKMAGIHPKQIWSYMHGLSKPRRAQIVKIENAVHRLGRELVNTAF
ncbi:MAG: hypothetical protein IKX67_02535 [Bacteroidales bacterium]|nr:hypothetical protein [Bacteroidales bacterium]